MTKKWTAIPIISDLRIVYYNKTTFDALSIKNPPPHGSSDVWTWDEFTSALVTIKTSMGKPAFYWPTGWDEELKLFAAVLRDKGINVIKEQTKNGKTIQTCGFRKNADAIDLVKKYFKRWYVDEGLADATTLFDAGKDTQDWLKAAPIDPLKEKQYLGGGGIDPVRLQFYPFHY